MNAKKMRESTKMLQADFWQRVGCTQSGGSRYENGRNIPKPIQMLLLLAYGNGQQRAKTLWKLQK